MIHYIPYAREQGRDIVSLWNASFAGDFPMDLRLWRQNVDNCDRTDFGGTWVAVCNGRAAGCVVTKRPSNIGAIFVAPDFRRQGIGTELLKLAVGGLMLDRGTKMVAGQDYQHFFPGIPETCLAAQALFTANGWNINPSGAAWDLKRSLDDYRISPDIAARIDELAAQGFVLRPCDEADVDSLFAHIAANFSERWLAETKQRVDMEPNPGEIIVAVRGGEVVGFCQTFSTASAKLGPSIYWRELLGAEYGGLGPIGVAKEVRKIGLGLALLAYSVDQIRKSGATQMVIDWTVLLDFYGRIGFEPWKRYLPASRGS
jgi:GNAT superfamily N-acetyltransferase